MAAENAAEFGVQREIMEILRTAHYFLHLIERDLTLEEQPDSGLPVPEIMPDENHPIDPPKGTFIAGRRR